MNASVMSIVGAGVGVAMMAILMGALVRLWIAGLRAARRARLAREREAHADD